MLNVSFIKKLVRETYQNGSIEEAAKDPCWNGYRQLGMKKKNGKEVPNCVPVKEARKGSLNDLIRKKEKEYWDKQPIIEPKDQKIGNATVTKDKKVNEATYQGKKVPLNKPMAGDVKKSKVYVDPDGDGKAQKVNFGDKNMTIKKNIPARRRSFRARHNCDNPGPKTKARYWSCRAW